MIGRNMFGTNDLAQVAAQLDDRICPRAMEVDNLWPNAGSR
jgi:hypothetical protein